MTAPNLADLSALLNQLYQRGQPDAPVLFCVQSGSRQTPLLLERVALEWGAGGGRETVRLTFSPPAVTTDDAAGPEDWVV